MNINTNKNIKTIRVKGCLENKYNEIKHVQYVQIEQTRSNIDYNKNEPEIKKKKEMCIDLIHPSNKHFV